MDPMSPERFVSKRIWRVPKTGPVEFFATKLCKALVQHGWPATWQFSDIPESLSFVVTRRKEAGPAGPDFWNAVEIAARVVAAQCNVEIVQWGGFIELAWEYEVTPRGELRRVK